MSDSTRTYISGNTFSVKDQLKAAGCRWDAQRKSWYAETPEIAAKATAIAQPHPLYNSPPPQDLGTTDLVAMAAKFGRKAVDGAKIQSFTGHGKPVDPDGTIVPSRGKTYVQVAAGRPRYFSRDMLEDFDMFTDEPGWQWQRYAVEVEMTSEELAADQVKADAKAARELALATLKTAAERVWKEGEFPKGEAAVLPSGAGTETIAADKAGVYSGPREHFVLGDGWIWYTVYNGSDGDDWSLNNLRSSYGHRLAFDSALADEVRAAAKILGYEREIEKGDPPRTEIRTAHGRVYQAACDSDDVEIDWTPAEPLAGHAEFTGGYPHEDGGQKTVRFSEMTGTGKKRTKIAARIAGRPDLAELVSLAGDLKAELTVHYGQED